MADLTAASILGLIVVPPEFPYIKVHPDERTAQFRRFRDSLKYHPGFKWVEDIYARHRGTSAAGGAGVARRASLRRHRPSGCEAVLLHDPCVALRDESGPRYFLLSHAHAALHVKRGSDASRLSS